MECPYRDDIKDCDLEEILWLNIERNTWLLKRFSTMEI